MVGDGNLYPRGITFVAHVLGNLRAAAPELPQAPKEAEGCAVAPAVGGIMLPSEQRTQRDEVKLSQAGQGPQDLTASRTTTTRSIFAARAEGGYCAIFGEISQVSGSIAPARSRRSMVDRRLIHGPGSVRIPFSAR